jgi:hypothetical protein
MSKNKNDKEQGAGKPAPRQISRDEIVQEAISYSVGIWGVAVPDDDITYHFLETICKRYRDKSAAAFLGERGGKSTSEAKRKSSAANGRKGGRPKKTK